MSVTLTRYTTPRAASEWMEDGRPVAGHEQGGLALPPHVLAAIAASRVSGQPCEFAVIGEERHSDGRWFLTFGANREHIEAVTDFRHHQGGLHYQCPTCMSWRGKHGRGCTGAAS